VILTPLPLTAVKYRLFMLAPLLDARAAASPGTEPPDPRVLEGETSAEALVRVLRVDDLSQ
jgi:hypothetical protein